MVLLRSHRRRVAHQETADAEQKMEILEHELRSARHRLSSSVSAVNGALDRVRRTTAALGDPIPVAIYMDA